MKVLVEGTEYEALASTALYETDYEAMILRWGSYIFPNWYTIPFKVRITGSQSVRVPDLALIAQDLSAWCVVEVEMAHHPLDAHVLPQVEAFCSGAYGEPHATALIKYLPDIEPSRLTAMVRETYPRVHVVVNVDMPSWTSALGSLGVTLSVVEVYRSNRDAIALRIGGHSPTLPTSNYTRIVRDSIVSNAFKLRDPRLLSQLSGSFLITIDGRKTRWHRPSSLHELIVPTGGDPLEGRNSVLVRFDASGSIYIDTNQPDI